MKLGNRRDYRGSRRYAPDVPSSKEGWLKRFGDRLAGWTKKKLHLVLRPGVEQTVETMWLIEGKGRNFSLLGAEYDRKPRGAIAPWPFPEGEPRTRRPIGYRTEGE